MTWDIIGQAVILTILTLCITIVVWGAFEASKQRKHEREMALLEARRTVIPAPEAQTPREPILPEGYDKIGDREL